VQTAAASGRNWKQELNNFLRQYRATPHCTTNMSPCEALNNRKLRTVLPEAPSASPTDIRDRDSERKAKIKDHADQNLHTKHSNLKVGDKVLVRQNKKNALSTPFDPSPYTVAWRKGNSVVAKRGQETIKRNISFFKIVNNVPDDPANSDDDAQMETINQHQEHHAQNQQADNGIPQGQYLGPQRDRPQRNRQVPVRLKDYVMT
jgi:hypothetical protein